MKRFLSLLFGSVAIAIASPISIRAAEQQARGDSPRSGPRAEFPQSLVDFGKVPPTEVQRHDFVVTNSGTETLVISNVSPGCGCTTAGDWDREIAPGKTGKIPVEFNPSNFSGAVTKTIVVSTNDGARPTHMLEIKATVWRPFELQPSFANFLPVEGEPGRETKIVRIVNNADVPAVLQPPQSSDVRFKTELKTVQPGKEFELHVTYDSESGAARSATITVGTSSKDQPVLTVTAFVMPQPAVVVVPATLLLPLNAAGQNYNHHVVIRNNGSAALRVTDAVSSSPGITVTIDEVQPGKLFYLNVVVAENFKPTLDRPMTISAKTSHPSFPEIRVPIVPTHAGLAPPENSRGAEGR